MDRREFLKTTSGAAAAAASAAAAAAAEGRERLSPPAIGAGRRELRLAVPGGDDSKGFGDSARRLARRIEALSGGRLRVELLGPEDEADLVHGTANDHRAQHPAFAYFAGLPGETGLPGPDLEAWLSIGGGQALWDELARPHGFKPLLAGHSGGAPALWTRLPPGSLGDLAGARVFAMGLGADVARALGAEPLSLAPHRLASALGEGSVGFVEWGGLFQSLALDLHTAATHAVGRGLSAHGTAFSLRVRLPTWESLGEADRAVITAAASEEYRLTLAEARTHETMLRKAMSEGHGLRFVPFPADIGDAIVRVADALVAHTAGHDALAERINRSYMAFKGAVSEAHSPLIS
jgi:TRAP-type mannitol/chloroaromatic compound transport system substrate-binding protein